MDERSVLEKWLDELPDEEIKREMDMWEQRMREANAEYAKRREILDLKARWRAQYGARTPTQKSVTAGAPKEGAPETLFPDRPSNLRAAVLAVVDTGSPTAQWTTSDIRDALVERGWMENSEKAVRTLQSALSRMQAEGRIVRVRHGIYRSAALGVASALAAANGLSDQGGETG